METSEKSIGKPVKKEQEEFDPRSIGIATTTFYPKWAPLLEGQVRSNDDIDGIRGDLALATISESARKGFQIVVVDALVSSEEFKSSLSSIANSNRDTHIFEEDEKGMSPGRRQAFKEVKALEGVEVIIWTEPEKVSIAKDCLPQAVQPILSGQVDVVVPKRDKAAFYTYPSYQVEWEEKANKEFNNLLKAHGLLPQDSDELDVWFGPKFIKNDPEVIKLFLHPWELDQSGNEEFRKLDPELWPNATFLPIVATLWRDKLLNRPPNVISVPVSYIHPQEQTRNEQDSEIMKDKRKQQYDNIIGATEALLQVFEYDTKSGNNLY